MNSLDELEYKMSSDFSNRAVTFFGFLSLFFSLSVKSIRFISKNTPDTLNTRHKNNQEWHMISPGMIACASC